MVQFPWPALDLARECNGPPRVPFLLGEAGLVLGSVGVPDLDALREWPDAFAIDIDASTGLPSAVRLLLAPEVRDTRLAVIHERLHARGRVRGWRGEPYPLRDRSGGEHATIERAASRFWGTLTWGAHCNGYVADADGRPTHLWIARRSDTKPTDPGRLDNLIGGGVPRGQSAREAVVREGWEESGLAPAQMAGLVEGSVLELDCDVHEGRQHERLFVFDLQLPAGLVPRNVDGEVAEHRLMPVDEAIARAASGELTTDAALVTLDFALRRGLWACGIEPNGGGAESTAAGACESRWRAFERLKIAVR